MLNTDRESCFPQKQKIGHLDLHQGTLLFVVLHMMSVTLLHPLLLWISTQETINIIVAVSLFIEPYLILRVNKFDRLFGIFRS